MNQQPSAPPPYAPAGYQTQPGYPPNYPPGPAYPQAGYPPQGYPQPGYPQQGYNPYPPQAYQYPPTSYQQQPQQTIIVTEGHHHHHHHDDDAAADCCLLACCWTLLCCCLLDHWENAPVVLHLPPAADVPWNLREHGGTWLCQRLERCSGARYDAFRIISVTRYRSSLGSDINVDSYVIAFAQSTTRCAAPFATLIVGTLHYVIRLHVGRTVVSSNHFSVLYSYSRRCAHTAKLPAHSRTESV